MFGFSKKLFAGDSGNDLKVGDLAPGFSLPASDGKTYSLADQKGSTVVLYFYPKDETPGCTKEACAFRDVNEDLAKRSVKVFGINTDSVESHKKFVKKYNLNFPLLTDEKKEVSKAYGALGTLGFSNRHTFIIAPDGKLRAIFRKVDVGNHAEEILKVLDQNG